MRRSSLNTKNKKAEDELIKVEQAWPKSCLFHETQFYCLTSTAPCGRHFSPEASFFYLSCACTYCLVSLI